VTGAQNDVTILGTNQKPVFSILTTIGRIGRKVGRWNIALQISKSGHFWRSDIAYLTTFAAQSRIIVEEKDFKIALLENMEGITWILADL
jgi:hypothetical protein